VSPDAIVRDTQTDKTKDHSTDSGSTSSEPKDQQLNYVARVSLDQTNIAVEDTLASLSPGMAVTVEIKTGSRRIISYLLSPLLKYQQEALRER
jgi:hemolysin D